MQDLNNIEQCSMWLMPMTLQLIENKRRRRDKLIILMEIIDIAKKETSKTHIMFRANLSYSQLNEYVDYLLHHNLMEKVYSNRKIRYKATCKGLDFFKRQEQVINMFISPWGLESRFNSKKNNCRFDLKPYKISLVY
jgi:predicted transcriptional regulator